MQMTPLKLSAILTTISMVLLIVVIYPLSAFILPRSGTFLALAFILLAVIFHTLNFVVIKILMTRFKERLGVGLFNRSVEIAFERLSYLKFYLGFVWRLVLLNVTSTALFEFFQINSGTVTSVLMMGVIIFFAFLWLLRFPYGKVKIKY